MHRVTRAWNVPLGIALFGGAVLVGGAILAYPETRRAPSRVDVGDPLANNPFPSFPDETHPPAVRATPIEEPIAPGYPTPIGGGPRTDVDEEGERDVQKAPAARPRDARDNTRSAPREPAPDRAEEPPERALSTAPPAAPPVAAPTADAATSESVDAGVAVAEAGLVADAPVMTDEAGSTAVSDAWPMGEGTPTILPMFGAPPLATTTPSGGAVTGPAPALTGGANPFGTTGGIGGGASGTNGGMSVGGATGFGGAGGGGSATTSENDKSGITAPMLVPFAAAARPETLWPAVSPHLRAGDFVVAYVGGNAQTFLSFADRARTDAPLVGYAVAFQTPAQLDAALTAGLPATLGTIGLADLTGMNDAALTTVATRVHAQSRRMFLTVQLPSELLPTIAARADVVELVAKGDVSAVVASAKTAATTLGPKVQLFVRLPEGLTTQSSTAAATQIQSAVPKAGVSLPWSDGLSTFVDDVR